MRYVGIAVAFFEIRIFQDPKICLILILMGAVMFTIAFNMVIN